MAKSPQATSLGEPRGAIAADLGVSRQAIDGWVSGARQPSRSRAILAALLERSSGQLAIEVLGADPNTPV